MSIYSVQTHDDGRIVRVYRTALGERLASVKTGDRTTREAVIEAMDIADARLAEEKHRDTAKRLYDEGWRLVEGKKRCIVRDGVEFMVSTQVLYALREHVKTLESPPPEARPRWTMTKRQREALRQDFAYNVYSKAMRQWGVLGGFDFNSYIAPRDCPGMRDNGPVVFLSDSTAESRAAGKVARYGDYLQTPGVITNPRWFVMDDGEWVQADDPGLL